MKITGPTEVKYLGFSFYIVKEKVRLRPHPKNTKKMKEKVRELTKRSSGRGYECQKAVLKEFIEGWVEYFKIADMKSQLKKIDQWVRHRIRCYIWKKWKTYKGRKSRLEQLGANEEKARMLAGSRKGLWATTAFRDLNYIITNKKLEAGGYPTFEQTYGIKQRKL